MGPGDHHQTPSPFFPMESLFQNNVDDRNRQPPPSVTQPIPCGPQDVINGGVVIMRRSVSFSGVDLSSDQELQMEMEMDDEVSEDNGPLGEKKRRLSSEQVKALERSFELGTKLEPERKMQLARALGLQPRQVAIWFQNRRARWKTKQMERDYENLKRQLELLTADNEVLRAQNKHFHSELMTLQSSRELSSGGLGTINLNKENVEASWSNGSESSADVNLGITGGTTTSMENIGLINPNVSQAAGSGGYHVFSSGMVLGGSMRSENFQGLSPTLIDHHESTSDIGGLSNMFNVNGTTTAVPEPPPSFWPWPEHPNFR